jgi:restriction system protein
LSKKGDDYMANYTTITSDKSKVKALGLCCLGFVGLGGIHDFYLGNYGKGIVKICTANWFLIGTIADLIKIASGGYRDNSGQPLRQ